MLKFLKEFYKIHCLLMMSLSSFWKLNVLTASPEHFQAWIWCHRFAARRLENSVHSLTLRRCLALASCSREYYYPHLLTQKDAGERLSQHHSSFSKWQQIKRSLCFCSIRGSVTWSRTRLILRLLGFLRLSLGGIHALWFFSQTLAPFLWPPSPSILVYRWQAKS